MWELIDIHSDNKDTKVGQIVTDTNSLCHSLSVSLSLSYSLCVLEHMYVKIYEIIYINEWIIIYINTNFGMSNSEKYE